MIRFPNAKHESRLPRLYCRTLAEWVKLLREIHPDAAPGNLRQLGGGGEAWLEDEIQQLGIVDRCTRRQQPGFLCPLANPPAIKAPG